MHDLLINSLVLVYQKENASQLGEWKRPYNLLSIQSKSIMIKLFYGLTKFRSTSLKSYFIDNQEPILESPASTQIPPAKAPSTETALAKIPQTKTLLANIPPIKHAAKSLLTTLASLTLVKQSHGQSRKYPK